MRAAFSEGVVRQWVGWCQAIATQYQAGRLVDLKDEIEKLAAQAEEEARVLRGDGANFLTVVSLQLQRRAAAEAAPDPRRASKRQEGARAEVLRAFAAAFDRAAERLQPAA